jgi:hypothetical protein
MPCKNQHPLRSPTGDALSRRWLLRRRDVVVPTHRPYQLPLQPHPQHLAATTEPSPEYGPLSLETIIGEHLRVAARESHLKACPIKGLRALPEGHCARSTKSRSLAATTDITKGKES